MSTDPNLKQPSSLMDMSAGPTYTQVIVSSIDNDAMPPMATCTDNMQRQISVRMDIQRGKGSIPAVGERWVIDKTLGLWTFCAVINGSPTGDSSVGLGAVSGLSDALSAHDDDLAQHDQRLDTLFSQGTVVAANGTTADVQHPDGTTTTGVQAIGAYQPTVGDTVWTGTVDAAGSKVALGTSADAGSNQQAYDVTVSHYLTTSRIREANVNIWSDHRIAAGDQGEPAVYEISMFHVDNTGHIMSNSELDLTIFGSDNAALLKNDNYKTGMLWGNGRIYFTDNNGLNRIPIEAGGWVVGVDGNNNPALISNGKNLALIAGADGMHVTNAANSASANLVAAAATLSSIHITGGINGDFGAAFGGATVFAGAGLTVTGLTQLNGGLIGTTGASLRGSTLQCDLLLCSPPGPTPTPNQILTYDLTATHNIACNGTIFGTVAPSERTLKDHVENLGDPWGFLERLVPARFTWKDTEHFDEDQHVGIYVDEMAEADPDTVLEMPEMPHGMFGVDEETGEPYGDLADRHNRNRGRYPDERALLAYVVRALQDAHSRIEELEAVIDSRPPTKE